MVNDIKDRACRVDLIELITLKGAVAYDSDTKISIKNERG